MADLVALRRRSLEHELAAHRLVLSSLQTVPAGRRDEEDWHNALDLYAHVLAAREHWLARIRGLTVEKARWFPRSATEAQLRAHTEVVHQSWLAFLEELSEADFDRWVPYTNWAGEAYENRLDDVFLQLEGHAHYHRGQIAALLRRLGGEPAVTDLVPRVRRRRPTT